MTKADPSTELMRMINGYQVSQAIPVAAALYRRSAERWTEILRCRGANVSDASNVALSIAPGTGCGRCISRTSNKEFSLTPLGVCLTSDAPGSRRNYARWIGTPGQWKSWGNLLRSIKSGESASEYTYGKDAWTYRKQHPEEQAIFD